MRNQQSVHKRAKDARWLSHRVGARTRRPQRPQTQGCVIVLAQSFARCETNRASTIRQPCPATVFPAQQAGYYFWCGGCENTQLAGKAWMPYKMNAQSFARCETNRAFINVQRMHDGGRTKSLHDAATPTTANARMHKDSHTKPLCKDA